VEALRRTIDALVKQNERLEERVTSHQRELASLREASQQRNGAVTGMGSRVFPRTVLFVVSCQQ
jgi:hypothetical protein